MNLKSIAPDAVPRAIELAERYRLLNEPEQAASICRDIVAIEPSHQAALRMLLLSLTDQFGHKPGASLQDAEAVLGSLSDPYEKAYYRGVMFERWARSKLHDGSPAHVAGGWFRKAMESFEEAEGLRPSHDDSALLRWNTITRLFETSPELAGESTAHELHLGD